MAVGGAFIKCISNAKPLLRQAMLALIASVMGASLALPTATYALAQANANRPFTWSDTLQPLQSAQPAKKQVLGAPATGGGTTVEKPVDRTPVREETDKRSAFTSTFVNRDGTRTLKYSPEQQNYQDANGKWQKIDNKLSVTKSNPGNKPNFFQSLMGEKETPDTPTEMQGKAGSMNVTMNPVQDGVKITSGSRTVTMKPLGVNNTLPTQKDDHTVIYKDAWPYVDLEYQLRGELVKEIIVIKDKRAKSTFDFTIDGGKVIAHPKLKDQLTIDGGKVIAHPKLKDQLTIAGFPDTFAFSQLTLDVNERGVISEQRVTQKVTDKGIQVVMDNTWMQAQPSSAFPMHIDPSFGQNATGYMMYKSDGYPCDFSRCYALIGTIYDGGWKSWRTYLQFPYDQLRGKNVLNANMHGTFKWGMNGIGDSRWIAMGHANCWGYECRGNGVGSALVNQDFDINFTNELRNSVNNGDFGAVWSFWGEEGQYKSYKTYDYMTAYIDYDTPTPPATLVAPADGQVVVDTQTTLKVNPVTDADGDAVRYRFRVSTNENAETGAVIDSNWIDTPQWTIPDGILQDGMTYYWHVYTSGARETGPLANQKRSFKVDLRTNKDSSQSYDTVGPIGVGLATGHATLDASSHSMNALGGEMGLGLTYSTPNKVKKGLIGEYWNVQSGYNFASGAPAATPNATRRDQNVDFNWGTGMPAPGVTSDTFYSRWTGQFVAPVTGSYQFGANADDNMRVVVNSTELVNTGYTNGAVAYGGAVTLQAGQVVPIRVEHLDSLGGASAKLYVKGAVTEQIVPRDWLYTNVTNEPQRTGLTGRYYLDNGDHNVDNAAKDPARFMLTRQDTNINLQFGIDGPAPGMQANNFMARWTGYLTVPTSGKYTIGAASDDGVRIKTGTGLSGAMEEITANSWGAQAGVFWGKEITLEANKPMPIVIDYMQAGGSAGINLIVKAADGTTPTVPATWLAPQANVLPDAWKLNVAVSGGAAYEHLRVTTSSVILDDTTGGTHEYVWKNNAYQPPANENGVLTKNDIDKTYTLLDADGRTYVFDFEGNLISLTTPSDDRQPSALKYFYDGSPSRLVRIEDGVTASRYGTVYYKGFNEGGMCAHSADYDEVPSGMLCAFKTSDGAETHFYYKAGQLVRIEFPDKQIVDYSYDLLGRIIAMRDNMAADAVRSGVRTNDSSVTTEVVYDSLGRVQTVTAPAAQAGGTRVSHRIDYKPAVTQLHINGSSEPMGFSKKVEYDALLRTTKETDITGQVASQEWDPVKDLKLSSTNNLGLKSTTIYDQLDRTTDVYGFAPSDWFGPERIPVTHIDEVPHIKSGYDEGITGLGISVYDNASLLRAPKLNSTAFNNLPNGSYNLDLTNSTVKPSDGLSFRATGKIRLDKTGLYKFRLQHGDGARLFIDNTLIMSNWADGAERTSPEGTYQNDKAGRLVSITIEGYKKGTTGTGVNSRLFASLSQLEPGSAAWSDTVGDKLAPAYNLATSTKVFDAQLGNTEVRTQYKDPAYAKISSTVLDAAGLNYTSTATYEDPGKGFLRQTSKTLAGGATTTYQYYNADETVVNPCSTSTPAAHQAGRLKLKTEPDPDGTGPQTGRTSEAVYNESGDIVAIRTNSDPWTCMEYDARGRVTKTTIPAVEGRAGRTIINVYAVGGNPLVKSTSDASGTIITENDLLGRTIKYTDAKGKVTTTTYDQFGKLLSRNSLVGKEEVEYDQFDRPVKQKLDGVTMATLSYDTYGRIQHIDYKAGLSVDTNSYDSLGRMNKISYNASGQIISDQVTRSVTGLVTSGVENGVNKSYTYDKASRLTDATIGSNTFKYEFGAQGDGCAAVAGYNAGRDGNRTKMTLNSKVTNYCYNGADQLKSSSDLWYTDVRYDSHGNTTRMGDLAHLTQFQYDASDRNTSITETDVAGNGFQSSYSRDVTGRIIGRSESTIAKWTWSSAGSAIYGYTSSGDSADFIMDGAGNVIQRYVNLAGGVRVMFNAKSTSAGAVTYSLSNLHGDTMATVNADGTSTIIAPSGPFGEQLPNDNDPANTLGSTTYDYLGSYQKLTDSKFTIRPMQMGARVYIAGLGRFLQVDPQEGGTDNSYVYVNDPVNNYDLNGMWGWGDLCNVVKTVVNVVVKAVVTVVAPIVKAVVDTAAKVATVVSNVTRAVVDYGRKVVATAVTVATAVYRYVAPKVVEGIREAGRVAEAFNQFNVKNGDLINIAASVAVIGVCAATAGVGCLAATVAAGAYSAYVAGAQAYDKTHDWRRVGAQALAAGALSFGAYKIGKALTGVLNVGERLGGTAVGMNSFAFELGAGYGAEAGVNAFCDGTGVC